MSNQGQKRARATIAGSTQPSPAQPLDSDAIPHLFLCLLSPRLTCIFLHSKGQGSHQTTQYSSSRHLLVTIHANTGLPACPVNTRDLTVSSPPSLQIQFFTFYFGFKTGSHFTVQAGFELAALFWPQAYEYRNSRPPNLDKVLL